MTVQREVRNDRTNLCGVHMTDFEEKLWELEALLKSAQFPWKVGLRATAIDTGFELIRRYRKRTEALEKIADCACEVSIGSEIWCDHDEIATKALTEKEEAG